MQNVLISIEDEAVDKVMYLLRNLSDVMVVEEEIERGEKSGRSTKTHQQIVKLLKHKYA